MTMSSMLLNTNIQNRGQYQKTPSLTVSVNQVLRCYFHNIDEKMVSKASSLRKSAGCLSQVHALQYHDLLSSRKYKVENKELGTQIAILDRKLATETLDPWKLMHHVDWPLWMKIPVSDPLMWQMLYAELWVNGLDGCWKSRFNMQLDLLK